MQLAVSTYIKGASPVHRCDARVKIALLAAYSVMLFFLDTWFGMALATAALVIAFAVSGIPARRVLGLGVPVYVLAAFTLLFNMFVFATPDMISQGGGQQLVYPLIGTFSFTMAGLVRGCYFALRILLLVFASLVVCFTSTSTELTNALSSFLAPLAHLGVPTDDIAMVFSIALRFIPVAAEEFCRVRDAQWSRGSHFAEGSLWQRLKAWQTVLIPLFVGLFRRADVLAQAMDARCYGMATERTSLGAMRLTGSSAVALAIGCAACIVLALFA